jgi:LCP family protein required for cell wall assembly
MGDGRGRTDVIVIATLNTKNKTVKLTSLMRDMLVQIPGYQDNKLNTAFEKGGLDLLYETIALNFAVRLDGCVMVNFENFEKIVDEIGGLELTLKQNEADYLNHTNYISNPKYRNVVAGTQLMNGNQVLGYARVRKTSTITGQNNDYGRTDRHRIVLNAIYEKCKSKNKTDLASLMFKFLPMITSDIDSKCFQAMLNSYLDMGMSTTDIEQLRIPADGTFQDNIRVRGMSVLIPDLEPNVEILHKFIFGDNSVTGAPTPTGAITNTPTGVNNSNAGDN